MAAGGENDLAKPVEEQRQPGLGWYERVMLRRAIEMPIYAWAEARGMPCPRWWELWKRKRWAEQVHAVREELVKILQEES